MLRSRVGTIVVTIVILFASAPSAWAPPTNSVPDLWFFRGTVRDSLGRGVGGVAVVVSHLDCNSLADPDQCVMKQALTSSAGAYEVGEKSPGEYFLVASRTGTTSDSHSVTVLSVSDQTVDFAVSYLVTGSLIPSNPFLSTANVEASRTLSITSWAPKSGSGSVGDSCVWVTDSRTGATTAASYAGPGAGSSSAFTWTLSAPPGSAEGPYSLSIWAQDCGGSIHLSTTSTVSYVVDNSPPRLKFAAPLNRGITVFTDSILVVIAGDNASGVKASSFAGLLVDLSNTTSQIIAMTYSDGVARSAGLQLVAGHDYRASVQGSDVAENWSSQSSEFRVSAASVGTARATSQSIPASSRKQGGVAELNDTYTWDDLPVIVQPAVVSILSSSHFGGGGLYVEVPTTSMVVSYDLVLPAFTRPIETETRLVQVPFVLPPGSTSTTSSTITGRLGRVTALVPKNAQNVALSLDIDAVTRFKTCKDPTLLTERCSTDPLLSDTAWSLLQLHPQLHALDDSNAIARAAGAVTPYGLPSERRFGGYQPDPIILFDQLQPATGVLTLYSGVRRNSDCEFGSEPITAMPNEAVAARQRFVDMGLCVELVETLSMDEETGSSVMGHSRIGGGSIPMEPSSSSVEQDYWHYQSRYEDFVGLRAVEVRMDIAWVFTGQCLVDQYQWDASSNWQPLTGWNPTWDDSGGDPDEVSGGCTTAASAWASSWFRTTTAAYVFCTPHAIAYIAKIEEAREKVYGSGAVSGSTERHSYRIDGVYVYCMPLYWAHYIGRNTDPSPIPQP